MNNWESYRPEDFLLFSERVYIRLLALLNEDWWPLQLLFVFLAVALGFLVVSQRRVLLNLGSFLLAGCWICTAAVFLSGYSAINWVMNYVIWLFVLQAVLLLTLIFSLPGFDRAFGIRWMGGLLIVYASVLHPFTSSILIGNPWYFESFGLHPDPVAYLTLAWLICFGYSWKILLLAGMPLLWCLFSGFTLLTLGLPGGWIPLIVAGYSVLAFICSRLVTTPIDPA